MDFPFTIDEFLGVFRSYNEAVWPAHVAAYAFGLAVVLAAAQGGRRASAVAVGVLTTF